MDLWQREMLQAEVLTLLAKGVIKKVELGVQFPLFPHPQKGWESQDNPIPHGPQLVSLAPEVQDVDNSLGEAGDWFATIDLRDAYYQIPMWEGHRQFLRFT